MTVPTNVDQHPVQAALDALQAERDVQWPSAQLAAHAALRAGLEASADRTRFVQPGDVVPEVSLSSPDGSVVTLAGLAAGGPIVVLLFRFEGCPACNVALRAYQASLVPDVVNRGSRVVAISPQAASLLPPIAARHELDITLLSCGGTDLLSRWGVGFSPSAEAREASLRAGHDMGEVLGYGSWELPYPTSLIIDRAGVVRFVDIHPNWMVRTEAAVLIGALDEVLASDER